METTQFIKAAKPSAAAKKLIADAQARVASLLELVNQCEPDRNGRTSQLHREADKIELEFLATPTRENAEKFHHALVRCQQSEISFPRIDSAIHALLPAAAAVAQPAALEILQSALDALDGEADAARDGIKRESVFLDIGKIDAAHALAKTELQDHRSAILQDPLHWLKTYGHA
jgi:hypothetical protein